MTLDLKAKAADVVSRWQCIMYGHKPTLVEEIEQALQEVQDATRRETMQKAVNFIPGLKQFICSCPSDVCPRIVKIQDELLSLLTTPEKKDE